MSRKAAFLRILASDAPKATPAPAAGSNWVVENGVGDFSAENLTREEAVRLAQEEANRVGRTRYAIDMDGGFTDGTVRCQPEC